MSQFSGGAVQSVSGSPDPAKRVVFLGGGWGRFRASGVAVRTPTSMGTSGTPLEYRRGARASALNSFEAGPTVALPVDAGAVRKIRLVYECAAMRGVYGCKLTTSTVNAVSPSLRTA